MKTLSRAFILGLVLLVAWRISACAVSVDCCQVNWTVPKWTPEDTGGHYGVIQLKLGNGPLQAKTVFFFGGHRSLIIRAPLYVLAAVAIFGVSILAFTCRVPLSRAANQRGGGDGGMSIQSRIGRPRAAAPHHGRWA